MSTPKIKVEVVLVDILERLKKLDALDCRLDAIEKEIEGVKKAMKLITVAVKIIGGAGTAVVFLWNIFSKFVPKGNHG